MKTKSLLLLVVAGGCGLVAAIAAAQHLAGNQPIIPVAPVEDQKAVVLAAADMEAGSTIKAEMLRVVQLPTKDLPEGTFTAIAELTGQVLRYPVFKGEPVLGGKLGRGWWSLSGELPEGMKACTVKIPEEENSMKGLIQPGNHVDCFWLPMKPDLSTTSLVQLLQNVKVLAVGERLEGDDTEVQSSRTAKASNESNYTLLVDSQQNKRVIAAGAKGGKFRLVLRGKGDNLLEELDHRRLDQMLGLIPNEPTMTEDPIAPEPEPETWRVDYIKGGDQSSEDVNLSERNRTSFKK